MARVTKDTMIGDLLQIDQNVAPLLLNIVHSEMKPDGRVKVYLEKPDAEDCFHSAVCWLPGYDWQEVHGFTLEEIARYQKIVESTAHLILQFSQEGGVENAAGF